MNYKFPEIRTINDVLPHIEGRTEFIVAEREGFTVVNYVVAFPDTFAMTGPDDLSGAIRRECRGIIFDDQGKIMSRPYHKFFNVNERDETQAHVLDLTQSHIVMDKLDGSMIRPVRQNGIIRLASKMGITDVALEAEKLLTDKQYDFLNQTMNWGLTPIFEYVSPTNKIVVNYSEPKLILTGIRDNVRGTYNDLRTFVGAVPFEVVKTNSSIHDFGAYLAFNRGETDREGDIIAFADGHRLKVKNDWYVRIHKTKDLVRVDRNVVDLIINEELDDVRSLLDQADLDRVNEVETNFWKDFANVEDRLAGLMLIARAVYGGDKKRVALELVPNLLKKTDASFIFKMLDGKPLRDMLIDHVRKCVGNTTRYEEMVEWMKL
jgi:RNA ligase